MTALPAQIGPYEVESEIGRGGMGVVYLATDSRLDRKVAIKALPEHFAADPERLARFEREAKILASLTHANIAAVYGLEEQESARYLVMEYVEGESLQALIQKGPVAVDEALRIAAQVASGIEAAHDAGVIHRDLKPGNIVVTLQGNAKVLDFGLAKEIEGRGSSLDLTNSPTATLKQTPSHHTAQGQIVGTAAYLSPEQARGKAIDRRTDIWAFGCVLYEMLTGACPYAGETMTDSLGAILHKEPEWSLLPPDTPPTIQLLLRRCLAKDSTRRLRDIGDARVEIEEALRDPSGTSLNLAGAALASPTRSASARAGWLVASTVFVFGAAIIGAMAYLWPTPETPEPLLVQRFVMPLPDGTELEPGFTPQFDVSDDGRFVVYVGLDADGEEMLYKRDIDQMDAIALAGTENSRAPTISPDGQWIVYAQGNDLKRMSIRGGPALTLASGVIPGFAWGDDGFITFSSDDATGRLRRVNENGGEILDIETTAGVDNGYRPLWPQPLPGGGVLFTARGDEAGGRLMAVRQFDDDPVLVMANASTGIVTESGHLLFHRDGALMVTTFDVETLQPTSQALPLFEGLLAREDAAFAHYAITDAGALFHIVGTLGTGGNFFSYFDLQGNPQPLPVQNAKVGGAALSPDEKRIALSGAQVDSRGFARSLWVLEIERDVLTKLTDSIQSMLLWSPDGEWIYYTAGPDHDRVGAVFRIRADGASEPEFIASSGDRLRIDSFSPDGTRLYCRRDPNDEAGEERDVVFIDLTAPDYPVIELFGGPGHQDTPQVSPDGRWVAYEDGTGSIGDVDQVFVARADGAGGRVQISRTEGSVPRWAPDGSKIYFSDMNDRTYSVVDVLSAPGDDQFRVSAPRQLFTLAGDQEILQLAPSGDRFFGFGFTFNDGEDAGDRFQIHVALNIYEELNRLAPTDGNK